MLSEFFSALTAFVAFSGATSYVDYAAVAVAFSIANVMISRSGEPGSAVKWYHLLSSTVLCVSFCAGMELLHPLRWIAAIQAAVVLAPSQRVSWPPMVASLLLIFWASNLAACGVSVDDSVSAWRFVCGSMAVAAFVGVRYAHQAAVPPYWTTVLAVPACFALLGTAMVVYNELPTLKTVMVAAAVGGARYASAVLPSGDRASKCVLRAVGAALAIHAVEVVVAVSDGTNEWHHFDTALVAIGGCVMSFAARGAVVGSPSDSDPGELFQPRSLLSTMMRNPKQRRLLVFLAINFSFMFVELVVGLHANSLGLISDSFHMLLDSMSVAIGLYAAYIAEWPSTPESPFGYARYEVLSGFTNGVLLAFLGVGIFVEALIRLYDPPPLNSPGLLVVSVGGLCVNIIGVVFFHEAHSHGHSHGGSCSGHGHGAHSHSHSSHGHSHGHDGAHGDCEAQPDVVQPQSLIDPNLRGVFYHVLADLLGSVGVITSTLIVQYTGFVRADAVCSLAVSCLVMFAATALLRDTAAVLLLRHPPTMTLSFDQVRKRVQQVPGVTEVNHLRIWEHASSAEEPSRCFVSVTCTDGADSAIVRLAVSEVLTTCGAAASFESVMVEVGF